MTTAIPGNISTTATITVNSVVSGSLDFTGDVDWWRASLITGYGYQIWLQGAPSGVGTLPDPYLGLYGSSGALLASNNDASIINRDAYYYLTPTSTGTYFISAAQWGNSAIGTYKLTLWQDQLPSTATAATIAPNSTVTDRIGWQGDTSDWYAITLTAGIT